jgi:hypothetical protein
MISVTTRAFLQESQMINFKIPENIKLKTGEYEIIIVINTVPLYETKKRKLTFAEHNYIFENPNITFSRADIYGDFGR